MHTHSNGFLVWYPVKTVWPRAASLYPDYSYKWHTLHLIDSHCNQLQLQPSLGLKWDIPCVNVCENES